MKKILTVSLVAIMAVSAARADIASVKYVDDSIKPVTESVATKAESATVEALTTRVGTAESNITNMGTTITNMGTELQGKIDLKQDMLDGDNFKVDPTAAGGNVISEISVVDGVVTYKTASVATSEGLQELSGTVGEHTEAIADLEAKDVELAGDIADINNATTGIAAVAAQNLASAKSELEGKINAKADTTTVSGIDGRLTTAEGEIDTLQAGIANVYTKAESDAEFIDADELAAGIAGKADKETVNAALAEKAAASEVTTLAGRVGANETAIAGINNETTGIAAVAAQNLASAKSELEGKINAKADTTTVNGIDTRLITAEGEIDTLQAGIADVYTKAEANALLDKKQNIFDGVEECTQNGAYDCAAVANKDGTFGWQRIVYTAADKTSTN